MANKLYVIALAAILSNAQVISQNENNRYGDDLHGDTIAVAANDHPPELVKMHNALNVEDSKQRLPLAESAVSTSPSIVDDRFMNENASDKGRRNVYLRNIPVIYTCMGDDLKAMSDEVGKWIGANCDRYYSFNDRMIVDVVKTDASSGWRFRCF